MNSKISLLGLLLIAQVILLAVIWFGQDRDVQSLDKWLDIDGAAIDSLVVQGAEGTVTLTKNGDAWQLDGIPADAIKVRVILDKLTAMTAPWPVATSASSATRFEVAPDNYQRRLQLLSGAEQQAELYLGTSPSFQRVHARQAGDDEIYSIALSNFELPLGLDGWMDKGLLSIAEPVSAVNVIIFNDEGEETHRLEQTAEGWLYNGEAANQEAAATYASRFKNLRVLNVAEPADTEIQRLASIELSWQNGAKTLYVAKQGEDYLLSEADRSYKVATYVAEQLLLVEVDLREAAELSDD